MFQHFYRILVSNFFLLNQNLDVAHLVQKRKTNFRPLSTLRIGPNIFTLFVF